MSFCAPNSASGKVNMQDANKPGVDGPESGEL